ncbi:glycerate kinase type-2 family protein [Merismopedia glauca]|nr:glycerate kinase [Merismopedia glauca]
MSTQVHAKQIYQAVLEAVDPYEAIQSHLQIEGNNLIIGKLSVSLTDKSRIFVVGAGKASAYMAQAVENILEDRLSCNERSRIAGGIVSVKDGHSKPTQRITIKEASHPQLDRRSLANGEQILKYCQQATAEDLILCLISGGGSALMEVLPFGINLEDLQATTQILMHQGADIVALNTVRKHLSLIKGGQLARWAYPARVCGLILSDVVGDDLSAIASGVTVPDPTTFADALQVLQQFDRERQVPTKIWDYFQQGVQNQLPETPKPGDRVFEKVYNLVIASNQLAIDSAAYQAQELGYQVEILTTSLTGEARLVAQEMVAIARSKQQLGAQKLCLLAGGETTVTVTGKGIGGRNQELALAAAIALEGVDGITILSAATDGGDGNSDATGAILDGYTVIRARELGLNPQQMLENNDSGSFFARLGDRIVTGATFTNVNDLVIVLLDTNS